MSEVKKELKRIAIETVRQKGIQGITFRDLGAAVGIKSSSVIYHFESKALLLQEIARDFSQDFFQELERIRAETSGVPRQLEALIDVFQHWEDTEQFCLCGMFAAESSQLDGDTRLIVQDYFLKMEAWVMQVLMESGTPLRHPPELTAILLVSSLEGALLLDLTEEKTRRLATVKAWIVDQIS